MVDHTKNPIPITTIWKQEDNGLVLVKKIAGLPFGTKDIIIVDGYGEAIRSGISKSGSGNNEKINEVQYTLK